MPNFFVFAMYRPLLILSLTLPCARSKPSRMKLTPAFILLFLIAGPLVAQIEPNAGTWKTLIIKSGSEFRLPPPPDAKATQAELKTMLAQPRPDAKTQQQITYWNAGSPGYRWRQFVYECKPPNNLRYGNVAALLQIALYEATIAAWDSKYAYRRPRPGIANHQLTPAIATPDSPSYPCEHAVAAGVAATVIARIFPQKADTVRQMAQAAAQSRVRAGVAYPSDAVAGYRLGQQVAERVLARMLADAPVAWDGKRPTGPGVFRGRIPYNPTLGSRKTLILTSGSQFRPGPPPDFTKDMAELKTTRRTTVTKARANYWLYQDFWRDVVDQKIREYRLDDNPPRAARIYALVDLARQEGTIACWDAKYAYWGIRPSEMDTTYVPELPTPSFPGYPSGHATFSTAAAVMMAYLFPAETDYFMEQAKEGAESRFDAGAHFRTDNEVGLALGRKVGDELVKWAKTDGADNGNEPARNTESVKKQALPKKSAMNTTRLTAAPK